MHKNYFPSGNEYISLPTINEQAELESINFLSMKDRGLIEIEGDPFLRPVIKVNETVFPLDQLLWQRQNNWIPQFKMKGEQLNVHGEYITPLQSKGFILRLTIKALEEIGPGQVGIEGSFSGVKHSINESKDVKGEKNVYPSDWNQGLMFDFRIGISQFAFCFLVEGGFDVNDYHYNEDGDILFTLLKEIPFHKGESYQIDIYCGIGLEEVGAAAQAIELYRMKAETLKGKLLDWLEERSQTIEEPHLNRLLNLNLFFNYFYGSGLTFDTEERVLCTSRSPRYYVSAAYWDRDSLIWSFPSFLIMDLKIAKEALDYVFDRQIKNIGIHSRYIDGTVLEPGFELDELCAVIMALWQYVEATQDLSILDEMPIRKGVLKVYENLKEKKHADYELYETFLMPTDDMHRYPYLTYNNVLVWHVFNIYESIFDHYEMMNLKNEVVEKSKQMQKDIRSFLTTTYQGKSVFAWSGDLKGHHELYDEPPGSLTLLAYYGFVSEADECFKNTMDYIYSSDFPHYFSETSFEELGCSHAEHPWVLSIANSLINGRKTIAYDLLKRTKMDNYIACESIDEYTGLPRTGEHFATCAGFLAYTLYKSWRTTDGETISWHWDHWK